MITKKILEEEIKRVKIAIKSMKESIAMSEIVLSAFEEKLIQEYGNVQ